MGSMTSIATGANALGTGVANNAGATVAGGVIQGSSTAAQFSGTSTQAGDVAAYGQMSAQAIDNMKLQSEIDMKANAAAAQINAIQSYTNAVSDGVKKNAKEVADMMKS